MPENLILWSAKRMQSFGRCPRSYYYEFIAFWNGWERDAGPSAAKAYQGKCLTTPEATAGNIIHAKINEVISAARAHDIPEPAHELGESAVRRFTSFLHYSAKTPIKDVKRKKPKLFLHALGKSLPEEDLRKFSERLYTSLVQFMNLEDVKFILQHPETVVAEICDVPPFTVGHELGVPAILIPDLVYATEGKIITCDWKSGIQDSAVAREQALVYDIYVRRKYPIADADYLVRFYYLKTPPVVQDFRFTEDERDEKLWEIGEQYQTLRDCSSDKRLNVADISRFAAHVSPLCAYCNFQTICPEYRRDNPIDLV